MPKRLLERTQPDCITEFLLAAQQRFHDGLALSSAGQRTGAIYLWGYTAEMLLKAAYFTQIGLSQSERITWNDHLQPAILRGRELGIAWPNQGAGHNVRA